MANRGDVSKSLPPPPPPRHIWEGFEIRQPGVGRERGFHLSKGASGAGSGFWHGKPNYSLLVKVFIAIITTLTVAKVH